MNLYSLGINAFSLKTENINGEQVFNLSFDSKNKLKMCTEILSIGDEKYVILTGYHYMEMKEHFYSYKLKHYNNNNNM